MKNVNIFILFAILFINLTPDIKNSIKQTPPKKLREYILWIIEAENKLKNFNEITVEDIELIKESILSQKSKENTEEDKTEDKTIECFLNKKIKKWYENNNKYIKFLENYSKLKEKNWQK